MNDIPDTQSVEIPQDQPWSPPEPLGSQTPAVRDEYASKLEKSARAAVERASDKLKAAADPNSEASKRDGEKLARQRAKDSDVKKAIVAGQEKVDADAKAKAAEKAPHLSVPSRFLQSAHADWDRTPDSVKAEVHRNLGNLDKGLTKYRDAAHSYENVRHYDEIARRNGGDLRQSLDRVVAIEQSFARNPVEGLQQVCQHFGYDLHTVASHIAKMRPEQLQVTQANSQVAALQQQVMQMQAQQSEVIHNVRSYQTAREVEAFAASHPRLEELSQSIAQEIAAGHSLESAYDRAVKLAGESKPKQQPTKSAVPKSIHGAPAYGSSPPAGKGSAPSIRESIRRAMRQ